MEIIKIENLGKEYVTKGETVTAVDNIYTDIESGEFVTVMGPSGSGKSTLLTMIGGLTTPTSGNIFIDGIDIYELTSNQLANLRREYFGFVFQSFQLIPYLTAFENVILSLVIKDLKISDKIEKSRNALEQVNLLDKGKRLIDELSGGEQQRVAIARAIVNDPVIILADEPTGNLDKKSSEAILKLISSFNDAGITIVMVTHSDLVQKYSKRTIYVEDGKIKRELNAIYELN